ncbi:MAG: DUF2207 domain-containing protein, partial [bacterium]|nr:DUF2207 domain-containing protein [bacterium]
MKKIGVIFALVFLFIFSSPTTVHGVNAQTDDIQLDQVNLKNIGITDSETTSETSSQTAITGEHIQKFDSNIQIHTDGTIAVKETIVYDFGALYKHGIYRTIPTIKTNKEGKKFKLDVQAMSVLDENGNWYKYDLIGSDDQLEFKIGNQDKTITGVHTYVISYKVLGALTYFSDHDELYWNATGNEWTVPIAKTLSLITLSSNVSQLNTACYTGSKGSSQQNCKSSSFKNGAAYISTNPLYSNEGMTVVFGFPKNIVAVLEPKPYVPFFETILGKLVILGMILLATLWYLIYPFYIIFKWYTQGRDPKSTTGVTTAWFDAPKLTSGRFMTPGEVGTLGDETVDLKDISATIVDLARRGYIRIEERKKADFWFVKTHSIDSELIEFERKLMSSMFGNKKEIRIKDAKLYETVEDVKKSLYEQVVNEKLFEKNPQSIRIFYTVIGSIAFFTGNLFLVAVAFLFGRNMPRKTVFGANCKNVAQSLKNFLISQERQLTFQASKQLMFEKLLPFAVAFGVEKIWAKRFESIGIQQPDWYRGY